MAIFLAVAFCTCWLGWKMGEKYFEEKGKKEDQEKEELERLKKEFERLKWGWSYCSRCVRIIKRENQTELIPKETVDAIVKYYEEWLVERDRPPTEEEIKAEEQERKVECDIIEELHGD